MAEATTETTGIANWINKFYKPTGTVRNVCRSVNKLLKLISNYKIVIHFLQAPYLMGYRIFGNQSTFETR